MTFQDQDFYEINYQTVEEIRFIKARIRLQEDWEKARRQTEHEIALYTIRSLRSAR